MAKSSFHEKQYILKDHIIPWFGASTDPREVTVFDVEDYCDDKVESLSGNTVVKHYHYLNQFFKHLAKIDIVDKNVVNLADRPTRSKSTAPKVWTAEQAQTYLYLIRQDTDQNKIHPSFELAIHCALLGGMRRGEAAGVLLSSVTLLEKMVQIRVDNNVVAYGSSIDIKGTKTGQIGTVVLPRESTWLFIAQLERHKTTLNHYGPELVGDYLTGNDLFQPNHPDWFTRTHRKLLQKDYSHILPYVRFHDLRHTHATILQKQGVDIKNISDRLRHSSISTTGNIYVHTNLEDQVGLASTVSKALWSN